MNKQKLYVDIASYIEKQNQISALKLSNFLIENNGFSDKQFSTGRPKLYVEVVIYLEKLVKDSVLKPLERDQNDCKYDVVSKLIQEPVSSKEEEAKNNNDQEDEDMQLSLF
ncbi:DUF3895 domain-containing protein [Metabacillus litoralis]|uniref:DUF3895 domain-containing protein n=1 Tax=Metabacillus litoralis TaxID=152268 RepID=UPI001CFE9489|nr:DUF3895 domain-containing protein [Metabacillus litoralis]